MGCWGGKPEIQSKSASRPVFGSTRFPTTRLSGKHKIRSRSGPQYVLHHYVTSKLYNETLYSTQQEYTETNHTSEVVDSGAAEQRQRAQEDFHQQQLVKQQQGFEMRQERQSNNSLV